MAGNGVAATLKVDRMLDYREESSGYVRGFTKFIMTVGDLGMYVVPIHDFGRAVTTFAFNMPPGMTRDGLAEKFDEFVRTSPVFQRINRDDMAAAEFQVQSLVRLGEDGYVGVYEGSGEKHGQHMLVVQSYDEYAAMRFKMDLNRRVRKQIDGGNPSTAERAARLSGKAPARKVILNEPARHPNWYKEAVRRGNINRRYIAAAFFAAIGLRVTTERCKANDLDDLVSVLVPGGITGEYPCTFLTPEGSNFMRVFNWAYTIHDVLKGAPWHMRLHEGLRTYYGVEDVIEDIRSRHISGAPMGSAHASRASFDFATEDADRVGKIVRWRAPLNPMLVADPRLRFHTPAEVARVEDAFKLKLLRVVVWQAIRVALASPDPMELTLKEHVIFGETDTIRVTFPSYLDLLEMWTTLTAFQQNRARIIHENPRAEDAMPADYALPSIRDLFSDELPFEAATNMERRILANLYLVHDRVAAFMTRFLGEPPREPGPRFHDAIAQRAAMIVIPAPARPRDELPLQSDDEPLGASDIDLSTDMSDTEFRVLQAPTQYWRGKSRPPEPAPARRANARPGMGREPRTPDQPPDDFYAELGVASDCPASEDDGR